MKRFSLWSIITLLMMVCCALKTMAAQNPITVHFNTGETNFIKRTIGSASYVVSVNPKVKPSNTSLSFKLLSAGNSTGLMTAQKTSGHSPCSGIPLCGKIFALAAGESCCLAFNLSSTQAGNYTLEPSITTLPTPAYSAQASPQPIIVRQFNDTLHEPQHPFSVYQWTGKRTFLIKQYNRYPQHHQCDG